MGAARWAAEGRCARRLGLGAAAVVAPVSAAAAEVVVAMVAAAVSEAAAARVWSLGVSGTERESRVVRLFFVTRCVAQMGRE
jgi:hypothetical protein